MFYSKDEEKRIKLKVILGLMLNKQSSHVRSNRGFFKSQEELCNKKVIEFVTSLNPNEDEMSEIINEFLTNGLGSSFRDCYNYYFQAIIVYFNNLNKFTISNKTIKYDFKTFKIEQKAIRRYYQSLPNKYIEKTLLRNRYFENKALQKRVQRILKYNTKKDI